jgi:carbamoyltransferase|tara:strand:+ start:626 stop:1228 length:603 start_codon:yes stop_codon:yes gene_type:complete
MLLTEIHRELDTVLDALIDEEQIVAIFQNESEWGPRALGNRSIMFDPRHPNAKNIVNTVKKREAYRPFACTVMLEHAEEYFDMLQLPESPWMSFAIQCKPKALKDIPTLVHADNTCRIQTVTEEQNPNYYNLIKGFYERTGVPIIFNTSFNLGGEAIVETVYDAIDTCNRSMINHLYIPEDQDVYIPWECIRDKTEYLPD